MQWENQRDWTPPNKKSKKNLEAHFQPQFNFGISCKLFLLTVVIFVLQLLLLLNLHIFHRSSHIVTMFYFLNYSHHVPKYVPNHISNICFKFLMYHPKMMFPEVPNSIPNVFPNILPIAPYFIPLFFAQNWTCITYKSELKGNTYILLFWGSAKHFKKNKINAIGQSKWLLVNNTK